MKSRPIPDLPALAFAGAILAGIAAGAAATRGEAAGAPAPAPTSRSCFLPRQVTSFDPVDRDTVNVEIGRRRVYQLELLGTCQDLDFNLRIGIRSTHGNSWVCQGQDAELIVPGPTGLDRCLVTQVRMLSDAEVEALRASRRKR